MNKRRRARAESRPSGDEGNEGKQESQGGDVSPTHSEGTVVSPKRQPKKGSPAVVRWSGDVIMQEAGDASADPPTTGKKQGSPVVPWSDDEIGVHAIQEHKQEQGGAQSLLDMDDDTISKLILRYFSLFKFDPPDYPDDYWFELTPQQLTELNQRLAFYRIRGYELSVDRQLLRLDNTYLEEQFSPASLLDKGYFKYYEEKLEWYFDPELCRRAGHDDYQRLVLCDDGEYHDWDKYHKIRNTYEQDEAYVRYCEAIANDTKWIEDYLAERPNQEHLWSVGFDHFNYKGMDGVYFEIWKRVCKQNYDDHVACIDETVSEDEALLLIKEAVMEMCPKPKSYVDYARKKLAIAADIDLAPKGKDVRPQCSGDNGKTKLAMD